MWMEKQHKKTHKKRMRKKYTKAAWQYVSKQIYKESLFIYIYRKTSLTLIVAYIDFFFVFFFVLGTK